MNTWPTSMCQWPATEDGTAFGITCAVLGAVLLIIIALGFGPLRAWIGMDIGRRQLGRHSTSEASNLLATWRLYRQLGRGDHFSVTDVPSAMVPNSMAEHAQDARHIPGSTTAVVGWKNDGQASLLDIDG